MQKFLLAAIISVVLISCKQDEVKIPSAIIQPEEYAVVLSDIHLLEAEVMEYRWPADSLRDYLDKNYQVIFTIHKITPAQFKKSYDFYLNHPKILKEIYEKVVEDLTLKEEKALHSN